MPTAAPDVAAAWTAGPAPVASGWTAGPAPTTPPATGSGNRFSDALDRLQSPTFAATNQKDASGNAVVDQSALGLANAGAPMKVVLAAIDQENRAKAAQAAPYLPAIGGAIGSLAGMPTVGAALGGAIGDAAKQEAQ